MVLTEDTILYRADHPNGFGFCAGFDVPDDEGWVTTPEAITPLDPPEYECSTLAAFQALLSSERAAYVALQGEAAQLAQAGANLAVRLSAAEARIAELEAQLTPKEG